MKRLLPLLLVAACGGETRILDLSGLEDGWKLVSVVSEDRRLAQSFPTFQVEAGRSDRNLEVGLAASDEVWLFELEEGNFLAPQGTVPPETLILRAGKPSTPPDYELRGSVLTEQGVFGGTAIPHHRLGEGGGLEVISPGDLENFLGRAKLERQIETEPCSPPVGVFEWGLDGAREIFTGIHEDYADTMTSGIDVPEPGTVVLLGEDLMTVVRDGELPRLDEGDDAARPVLPKARFGTEKKRASLMDLLPLGGGRYVVGGWLGEEGAFWEVELTEAGLSIVDTATVPTQVERIARDRDRLLAIDGAGNLLEFPLPDGPWAIVQYGLATPPTGTRIAARDGSVATLVDGVVILSTPLGSRELSLTAPVGQLSAADSLAWSPENRLWVGMDGGDLGVVDPDGGTEWLGPVPARLGQCGTLADDFVRPHVEEQVRDIAFFEDWAFVVFRFCDGVWALRRSDRCAGLLLPFGDIVRSTDRTKHRLRIAHGRIYVGGQGGLLSSAPLLEAE